MILHEIIHNVLIHPLMTLLPEEWAAGLHDWHADMVFGEDRFDELKLEGKENATAFLHNAIVHPLMCLLPAKAANRLHDHHVSHAL